MTAVEVKFTVNGNERVLSVAWPSAPAEQQPWPPLFLPQSKWDVAKANAGRVPLSWTDGRCSRVSRWRFRRKAVDSLTIEGLAADGPEAGLHPLQKAFISEAAIQCGYCTPGMILTPRPCWIASWLPHWGPLRRPSSGMVPPYGIRQPGRRGHSGSGGGDEGGGLDAAATATEPSEGSADGSAADSGGDAGSPASMPRRRPRAWVSMLPIWRSRAWCMAPERCAARIHMRAGAERAVAEALPGFRGLVKASEVPRACGTWFNLRRKELGNSRSRMMGVRFIGDPVLVVAADDGWLAAREAIWR